MLYVTKDKNMGRKEEIEKQKKERLGLEKYNNQGCLMKIVEYNSTRNVIVEFQDEWKRKVPTTWQNFNIGGIKNPHIYERIGLETYNNQGSLMKIVEYNNASDLTIEFQDEYKTQIKTIWCAFKAGEIKNPYYPSVCGVGIVGNKYKTYIDGRNIKEYIIWNSMIQRCYSKKEKNKYPTYKDATCCKEWLLFENFYEWLHDQENFEKWYNGERWAVDKDILVKGNKIYSPDTCCLVPPNVNILFTKCNNSRGDYPIGIYYNKQINKYHASLSMNILYGKKYIRQLGDYPTAKDAFYLGYKPAKEKYIKQVAQKEYDKGNITKICYDAMMNYQVEITD